MTSKRKPGELSPIPAVVEVAENGVHNSLLMRFHSPSFPEKAGTGTKHVTPSPLAVFQGDGRYFKHQASSDHSYGGDGDSTTVPERLGIRKPSYYRDDDSSRQTNGGSSFRIGITRPSYEESPEGGTPLSPLNLFLERKAASPTPNLIELDRSEDSAEPYAGWRSSRERNSTLRANAGGHEQQDDDVKDDDSIERMIHEATAEGHYLVSSTALSTPKDDIKFSLTKGKGGLNKAMRRASERHVTRPPRPPLDGQSRSVPGRLGAPDASFKIFLLLLNPQAKIFELIQVIYAPSVTTLGDVLAMIPGNASEPALGSLTYSGLCRPKDGVEITDMTIMASGSHCKLSCARIMLGEILVAIPKGFTGEKCAKLAVPILKNQRIQKLLKRSDPLGVKRDHKQRKSVRRSSSSSHPRRRRRSSSASSSKVETVKEEPEHGENSPQIKQAMKHAMEAAARDNAGLPDNNQESLSRSNSENSLDYWRTVTDLASTNDTASLNDSIASSVASASSYNSFTIQTASRRLPRLSTTRRKHVREQRKHYVGRVVVVAMAAMVTRFMTDESAPKDREDMHEIFGWMGMLQFLIVFVAIIKLQMFARGHSADTKCPFVRASLAAAATFQEQFTSKQSTQMHK